MPPMKFLCLHGAGTSAEILTAQLSPLTRELHKEHSITLFFLSGEVASPAGPGVSGFYEGPFYSYYNWPRGMDEDDSSIQDAYELLYSAIESDGPFDGLLGFSHGGALAAGFLAHHARKNPYEAPLFRCAVFFNSVPPFQMGEDEIPVFDDGIRGMITLPTLHVVGKDDFVLKYSMRLYDTCEENSREILVHDRGHEIPTDRKEVAKMAKAIQGLCSRSMFY